MWTPRRDSVVVGQVKKGKLIFQKRTPIKIDFFSTKIRHASDETDQMALQSIPFNWRNTLG
jgi:hypothetical protein